MRWSAFPRSVARRDVGIDRRKKKELRKLLPKVQGGRQKVVAALQRGRARQAQRFQALDEAIEPFFAIGCDIHALVVQEPAFSP